MSGHSKWSTIKRKKSVTDAKRGVIFTQISKDIALAARENGADPDINSMLRLAIKKAKSVNMPSSNIDRAINKGIGNIPGIKYENYIYEGYGPGGVAILIEVMTENKNRTVPEIRNIMSKSGGNLGETGCVNWMFEKKGIITVKKQGINENELFEKSLEFGAEDFLLDEDIYEISTSAETFGSVCIELEKSGFDIDGEVGLIPKNTIKVNDADVKKLISLIENLENHEDIQKVYSNLNYHNIND